ncbi:MAG: PQQ-dependent sugar dehydrogenase [Chloroflexota bacterium]
MNVRHRAAAIGAMLILSACSASPTTAPAPASTPSAQPTASKPAPAATQAPTAAPAPPKPTEPPKTAAQPAAAATLVVNDAATANPNLKPSEVRLPGGGSYKQQTVRLPEGFSMSIMAAGLRQPRFMAFDGHGNLLVGDARAGNVYRFPASQVNGGEATVAPPRPLIGGLDAPSNVALFSAPDGEYLYVGETGAVARYRYAADGVIGQRQVVIPDLPKGGHNTRTVAFGPDGKLYLAVGSSCNICEERDEKRATVLRYNPDGSGYERFAWGLRNAVGLAFQPGTTNLWATVNERDNQGNEIPPDLVTIVSPGKFYGWPSCQPPNAKPQSGSESCQNVTPPTVGIQAHSAPLGLAFYTGAQFPEDYRGDLFVVQHGSWNRQPPAEPKLLRIKFQNGVPVSATDFATGWQMADGGRWGRPAGVIVAPDGALLVSDDQASVIYRVSYKK